MSLSYAAVIILGMVGMGSIDWRYKLAFFYDRKRTLVSVLAMVTFFLVWDLAGIGLGIFFAGNSRYSSGVMIAPDLPIEEPMFLTLLCYMPLVMYRKFAK